MKSLEDIPVSSVMVALVALFAALFTYPVSAWYIPALGGIVALVGVLTGRRTFNNVGMLFTGLSFYILNRNLPFSDINIIVILGMFFALYSVWHTGNREMLLDEMGGDEDIDILKRYWKSSNLYLIGHVITAFSLSFLGIYVARYSYLGIELDPMSAIPVAVIFGLLVLFTIYIVVEVLPRYADSN